jgi:hypothetical protein
MPGGRPTRLTEKVQNDVCVAVRASTPLHWAAQFAGVDAATLRKWRQVATSAAGKRPRERSQHERRCIAFFTEVERAEAAAFIMGWQRILDASSPTTLVTDRTTSKVTEDGEVLETVTVTESRQAPGNWQAMAHLMERRFPKDMHMATALEVSGPDGGPLTVVSNDEAWADLQRVRDERKHAAT